MERPKVSVIIPTYNRAIYVTKAIDSVLSQTYTNFEIIVVDDGSTDDTKEALEPYLGGIRYIHQQNSGPSAARNRGITAANSEWIAFLDSDDTWFPNKIEVQLPLCINLGADLCFHDICISNPNGENIPSWNAYINEQNQGRLSLETGILPDAYQHMMTTGHLFLTTSFMVKRSALNEAGYFNENLRTSEDLELYFRLAARYRVAFISKILAIYSPGTHRVTDKERIYSERINAICTSLEDRLKVKDMTLALWARNGLLQEMRSLGGAYRQTGCYKKAVKTYVKYMQMKSASLEKLVGLMGEVKSR